MADVPKPRSQERGKRRGYACGRWKKAEVALRIFRRGHHAHKYANFQIPGKITGTVHFSAIPLLTGMFLHPVDRTNHKEKP